jgi:hypothetical protein
VRACRPRPGPMAILGSGTSAILGAPPLAAHPLRLGSKAITFFHRSPGGSARYPDLGTLPVAHPTCSCPMRMK